MKIKNMFMLVVFVVTWKSYVAKKTYSQYIIVGQDIDECVVIDKDFRKEFSTLAEARREAEAIASDRKNWDVKVFKMDEVK